MDVWRGSGKALPLVPDRCTPILEPRAVLLCTKSQASRGPRERRSLKIIEIVKWRLPHQVIDASTRVCTGSESQDVIGDCCYGTSTAAGVFISPSDYRWGFLLEQRHVIGPLPAIGPIRGQAWCDVILQRWCWVTGRDLAGQYEPFDIVYGQNLLYMHSAS